MYICPACPDAVACMQGGPEAPCLSGEVQFYQKRGAVLVAVHVSGLPRQSETGFFALHIHEGGSCSGENFSDTGGHYNPHNEAHPRHAGDLPPLFSDEYGNAFAQVFIDRTNVREVSGKPIVVHAMPDDFKTQPAGASGVRLACGLLAENL